MATLWLTYAWADNTRRDVDYLAQELERAGLTVKLDRWNLQAGGRLWEQIDAFITNPSMSDAWAIYATQNSLGSEACREELAYALDRALSSRGSTFPLIAISSGGVDHTLFPTSLKSRLYVDTRDPGWTERVKAAAEQRAPVLEKPEVQPIDITVHPRPTGKFTIEIRPRAGTLFPFTFGILLHERERVQPSINAAPPGTTRFGGFVTIQNFEDEGWYYETLQGAAITPTTSCFLVCNELPSRLRFGVEGATMWEGGFERM